MQDDINNMITDSQLVAKQDSHSFVTEHIPRECNKLQEKIQRDTAGGIFHTSSYYLLFGGRIADSVGCEKIADSVSSYFPGLGVEYGWDRYKGYRCQVYIQSTIEPGIEREISMFDSVKAGYYSSPFSSRFYTGPDPASCQALANRLNSMNSENSPHQVVCKATTTTRGMCNIDMELKKKGLVQRLMSMFSY